MTRILTYNILLGGAPRIDQLTRIIRSSQADIIGLAEATNPRVVEELAQRLGMQFCMSGRGRHERDWQLALLSRFPIVDVQVHSRPSIFTRRYLLEASVEEPGGKRLTAFITHLTARFDMRTEGNRIRQDEVQEILNLMASRHGTRHVLLGDFNSLAPGDAMKGSVIMREREQEYWRKYRPYLIQREQHNFLLRMRRSMLEVALKFALHNRFGRSLLDKISTRYAQGGIDLLLNAGYIDCFRRLHPRMLGYTYSSSSPACRIDYIFASPELAQCLASCNVVTEGEGVSVYEASDHLAVCATFEE